MDSLLACIDEIALDGLDGCPILQLWKHLEERTPAFPLKVDDAAKQFLWRRIASTSDLVEFFVLLEPLPHIFGIKNDGVAKKEPVDNKPKNPLDEFKGVQRDSNIFKVVSDQEAGIRGSCPSYSVRRNVTKEVQGQPDGDIISLNAAYERWGDCLVMVAAQELRDKALLGLSFDPNVLMSDVQYCLLEHVGQARYKGRMQRSISSSYMKIEPRTTFHHLKGLKRMGLVSRQSVVITTCDGNQQSRNYQTNIVRLTRFHVQEFHKYDVIASRLSKLLVAAPDQQLPLTDVIKNFDDVKPTVLRKIRRFLQQGGYVLVEPLASAKDEGDDSSPPKKKKKRKSEASATNLKGLNVRLLKPFVLKTDSIRCEDDDDDEEEDDEEDPWAEDYDCNLIAEQPIMRQMYDVVEKAGSQGYTLKKFQRVTKLPFYDARLFLKHLKRDKMVHEVHQDVGKTRVMWFVAAPYAKNNTQAMKVKQERDKLKDKLKEVEDKATGTPGISPISSPCPSPAPSLQAEGSDAGERKSKKMKSLIGERVTYRSLRRKTVVMEHLQKVKVVEGSIPLLKVVISSEEEEGQDGRIDRKVLYRLLEELTDQGLIRKLTTVVDHGSVSQKVELYLDSSIANHDPAVAFALEQCRSRLADQSSKLAEKIEKEKERVEEKEKKKTEREAEQEKKKLEQQKKKDTVLTPEMEAADKRRKAEQQKELSNKYGYLPKFPRLQLIHKLIWRLVHDRDAAHQAPSTFHAVENDPDSAPLPGAESSQKAEDWTVIEVDGTIICDSQRNWSEDDDWMNRLEPLQRSYTEDNEPAPGWFRIADVLPVMPVFILCQAMIITEEIKELDDFVLDPVKKFTPLRDLPYDLKMALTGKSRFKAVIKELVCLLSQVGLVTPCLPIPPNHNNTRVFLSKGVKLLDTTTSIANYQTICAPPGAPFESRSHWFTSMEALRGFWNDLKCVSLNTPLGLVRMDEGSTDRMPLSVLNKNKRLIQFAKADVDEEGIDLPPGDKLGAAGLDRSLYSHFKRNWTKVMEQGAKQTFTKEKRLLPTSAAIRAAEQESNALSVGLLMPQDRRTFVSLGVAETRKQARKGSKGQKKQKLKRKAEEKDAEGSVAKKSRTESTEKQASEAASKQAQDKLRRDIKRGHLTAVDQEDRNVLARKAVERISFTAEEDSWLLLFRIALGVMKNETTKFYPFVCMRNILHKTVTSSLDKTAPNLQRRICKLMKNPHSQLTMKICLAECSYDETFRGFDAPLLPFEETFLEVVRKLRQKFSASSLAIGGEFTLFSSLEELYDKYKVQTLASKEACLSDQKIASLGSAIETIRDVNKAAIRDQIQIAFTTPQETYDAFRVFQMFNPYAKEELEEVFKDMQKKNLVARKKHLENPSNQYTRALPFVSMTYQLSWGYHRLFLRGFQLVTFYRDCADFLSQLVKGQRHTLSDPRTGSSKEEPQEVQDDTTCMPGSIEFRPKSALGGHVACILSLLATRKVSVEVRIPDEILNMDPSELSQHKPETTESNTDSEQETSQPVTKKTDTATTTVPSPTKGKGPQKIDTIAAKLSTTKGKTDTISAVPSLTKGKTPQKIDTIAAKVSATKGKASKKADATSPVPSTSKGTSVEKSKAIAAQPSTKAKKLEKQEVFTLSFPSSTVATFTSPYSLKSIKESCSALDSHTETSEVSSKGPQRSVQSTIPVASLSYGRVSSRSSRTALMLARGGADPYVSINQLPARALNTHDFMSLHACRNVLTLKDGVSEEDVVEVNAFSRETVGEASKGGSNIVSSIEEGQLQNEKCLDDKSSSSSVGTSIREEGQSQTEKCLDKRLSSSSAQLQETINLRDTHSETEPAIQGHVQSPTSQYDSSTTSPVIVTTDVSIEDHIERSKKDLGFREGDILLTRLIYGLVAKEEELGVTVALLKERINESHKNELCSAQHSFDEHVEYMCLNRLLYRIGVYEPSLVAASFVKPWSVTLLKPKERRHDISQKEGDDKEHASGKRPLASTHASLDAELTVPQDSPAKQIETEKGITELLEGQPSSSVDGNATIQTSQIGSSGGNTTSQINQTGFIGGNTTSETSQRGSTSGNTTSQTSQTGFIGGNTTSGTSQTGFIGGNTTSGTSQTGFIGGNTTSETSQTGSTGGDTTSQTSQTSSIGGNTTSQTSQTGSTSEQSAGKETASSETVDDLQDVGSTCGNTKSDGQTEGNGEASSSFEGKDNSSSKQTGRQEIKKKRYKGKSYERYFVVCRPWITIDGTTSLELLRMFREMVLMLILDKPGISESAIAQHFFEALRPVALKDILESLVLEECIDRHARVLPPRTGLFSRPKTNEPIETLTFYTPRVDCILKLATSKISGYT